MYEDQTEVAPTWIPSTPNARFLLGERVSCLAWPEFLQSMEGVSPNLSPEQWRAHILKGEGDEDGLLVTAMAHARCENLSTGSVQKPLFSPGQACAVSAPVKSLADAKPLTASGPRLPHLRVCLCRHCLPGRRCPRLNVGFW